MTGQRPLRVLLLVNQFPPDVNTTGKLMQALAAELVRRGHHVHVVTTFPHYAQFRVEPQYRGRLHESALEDGVAVTRVWSFASGEKQKMSHRLANYLSYNGCAFLAAQLGQAEYDVILAPNGSFFTGITAWLVGVLRGAPFLYNVQDIYPDVPLRAGQLERAWQVRGLAGIERFMYARAHHITVISEAQRSNLLSKGVPAERISVVPNFVDAQRFQVGIPRNEYGQRWRGKFVAMHAGNLGFAYDFATLLKAASCLADLPDMHVVIVGDGVLKNELQEDVRARGLTNVEFLPFQPEDQLPALRAAAAVQLSLYRRGSSELSLPSKLYEIMASGRPLIASAEPTSDIAALLQSARAGLCIDPEDVGQLVAALRRLHADAAERDAMGRAGRAYVSAHHSVSAAADAYETLLERAARQH
jgi:colanic acid biosynthesis glycosyl transferase WcaI